MKNYLLGLIMLAILGCQNTKESLSAEEVVEKAITFSGKNKLDQNQLSFTFREYDYRSTPTCNGFKLERTSKKEPITDVLIHDELTRFYKDSIIKLADSTTFNYYESVNSVHYFMQLPLRLNDEAVNLTHLGQESINDKSYHKLQVKFSEDGGGVDFEDVYLYWFDMEDYSMDYLAYSFIVNDGGLRFRKAINRRTIEGVVFQDYENYKPKVKSNKLNDIAQMYVNDDLELLSLIENENIELVPIQLECN